MEEQFVQYDLLKNSDRFKMLHDIKSQPMQHDKNGNQATDNGCD